MLLLLLSVSLSFFRRRIVLVPTASLICQNFNRKTIHNLFHRIEEHIAKYCGIICDFSRLSGTDPPLFSDILRRCYDIYKKLRFLSALKKSRSPERLSRSLHTGYALLNFSLGCLQRGHFQSSGRSSNATPSCSAGS